MAIFSGLKIADFPGLCVASLIDILKDNKSLRLIIIVAILNMLV